MEESKISKRGIGDVAQLVEFLPSVCMKPRVCSSALSAVGVNKEVHENLGERITHVYLGNTHIIKVESLPCPLLCGLRELQTELRPQAKRVREPTPSS